MNSDNIKKFMSKSSNHVSNLNRVLKNIKSDIMVNFIHLDPLGIMIITSKVASKSDLQSINNYVKFTNSIDSNDVKVPHLPQSKSYLKIISILYFQEVSLSPITPKLVKDIIKQNQIFDNVILVSKPCVIKAFPKSYMTIVWLDIWDVQSGSKTKGLINRCFNVGNNITTIKGENINPGILQCKNCLK